MIQSTVFFVIYITKRNGTAFWPQHRSVAAATVRKSITPQLRCDAVALPSATAILRPQFVTRSAICNHATDYRCTRHFTTIDYSSEHSTVRDLVGLFSNIPYDSRLLDREDLLRKVAILKDELVGVAKDSDKVLAILDDNLESLYRRHPGGAAFVELLDSLLSSPDLLLLVLNWRRKVSLDGIPMTREEYSKAIKAAGRLGNVDLAVEIFDEAANNQLKTTCTYNAMLGAFMFNGLPYKCQSLFRKMKREAICSPDIVTYNILISVYGKMMLINHMEKIVEEIHNSDLSPNIRTYNHIIAAYVTAWDWDRMEQTFQMLKSSLVEPETQTYLLMLRGYAHSGNLEKMEEMYQLVRDNSKEDKFPLIRAMILAYCKSTAPDRIEKIERLLKLIPEKQYRPWLHVLLIKFYAEEDWLEAMENSINDAFERKVSVNSARIMRSIIGSYFRKNVVDGLEDFVKRAERCGWKICRSLYHSKMVMYGSQMRLEDMESVLNDMENVNINSTKNTLLIMYNAYVSCGHRSKVDKILGLMCKRGYEFPVSAFPS